MVKIAVIGICGNSVFMCADHFHENGETVVADSVFDEVGGKGSNQAIAAVRMGAEAFFLAAIGDDSGGEICRQALTSNGVKATFKVKDGKRTPFAYILTDKHGENRVTEYKSAELGIEDVLAFEEKIAAADILLLQHEVPHEVNEAAVALAKKHNVRVILNPAPYRDVPAELAKDIYAVTPNEQEAQGIKDIHFENKIITLGKRGCEINRKTVVPAIDVTAIDTTGAGDTFNGIFAVCIAEGMNLETACRYAVIGSGLSVSRRYVLEAIPYRQEIERIYKEVYGEN